MSIETQRAIRRPDGKGKVHGVGMWSGGFTVEDKYANHRASYCGAHSGGMEAVLLKETEPEDRCKVCWPEHLREARS